MKLFIAIAVGLAIVALTQAQEDSNESEELISPIPPSDEAIPPRPEGIPHGRPGRPFRRPFAYRDPRPQPQEDEQADSENPDNNPPQGWPQRRPVFFDIKFDFGKNNKIRGSRATTTGAP